MTHDLRHNLNKNHTLMCFKHFMNEKGIWLILIIHIFVYKSTKKMLDTASIALYNCVKSRKELIDWPDIIEPVYSPPPCGEVSPIPSGNLGSEGSKTGCLPIFKRSEHWVTAPARSGGQFLTQNFFLPKMCHFSRIMIICQKTVIFSKKRCIMGLWKFIIYWFL